LGCDEGEDVVFCAFENALENGQIRDHTTGVEVLVSVKDQVVAVIGDFEVIVTRVDSP